MDTADMDSADMVGMGFDHMATVDNLVADMDFARKDSVDTGFADKDSARMELADLAAVDIEPAVADIVFADFGFH